MSKLQGKTAIVTGGGAGIGKAIAEKFYSEGAKVAIFDLDKDAGATFQDKGEDRAFYQACNVADADSVKQSVTAVTEHFDSSIDILVNNAGIAHIGTAVSTEPADFDKIFDVNVKGVYHCLHTIIPQMISNPQGGVILNMSSIAAIAALPDRFAYSMSKGAVQAITYSVAADYIDQGIRCNSICPARVHTPFVDGFLENNYPDNKEEMFAKLSKAQPIGRMATPEEVADLALYLCCDESAFLTGQAIPLDGGYMNIR